MKFRAFREQQDSNCRAVCGLRGALPVALLAIMFLPGCLFHRHRNADLAAPVNPGDQPDKILYEKALNEINHGRYDVGRLTLQTLINTYPDSEYLSKAKLTIADSYYREGGISGLTQAELEYKDFITFFPTAPEAPMAQYRAGMAHFRLMSKADRDHAEAKQAEAEFKEFLTKYPDSPVAVRVKGRLREVQEVLGEGNYEIAKFYYDRRAYPAAESRFKQIISDYPDYSQGDAARWYLAQSLTSLKRPREAIPFYDQILTDFPLSPFADQAKEQLQAMHQPIPKPTKSMLARAQADAEYRTKKGLLSRMGNSLSGSPDLSETLHGPVHIGHPDAGQTEVAQAPPPEPPAAAAVSASTPGDAALKAGKAVPVKGDPQTAASGSSNASAANSSSAGSSSSQPTTAKKKGRFHFLKKLNPF